ncbi:MAG: GTPase domain-containing protein [Veillonellales bacterium]
MKEFVIVGRPNSGKTMFALNFAGYMGCKTIDITFRTYDGVISCRRFTVEEAKRELCGMTTHKTRSLQSIVLHIALRKTRVNFKLTDTCGLIEKIHSDEAIRRGMAQTISLVRSADFIIHIVDFSGGAIDEFKNSNNIDAEIFDYGIVRHAYALIINKIDLPSVKEQIGRITALFPNALIIPASGMYGYGFKEVKACVSRNI